MREAHENETARASCAGGDGEVADVLDVGDGEKSLWPRRKQSPGRIDDRIATSAGVVEALGRRQVASAHLGPSVRRQLLRR
jgi:hypothetical protein